MRTLTRDELSTEYPIYKTLSSTKSRKTQIALKEHSDGSFYPVVLKELDDKRAYIYHALSSMWNPHIADTYEVIYVTSTGHPEMNTFIAVTEYVCAEGSPDNEYISLASFIRKNGTLQKNTALSICVQICTGLREFHQNGFVHRDLKPENIMIAKYDLEHPTIKIVDFGGATHINPAKSMDTTIIGTLGYQAPESIATRTTRQSDIYSIGCILNFMLTGQLPALKEYKGNHYITHIIERATNEDPSHRYSNVTSMQKEIEHELRIRFLDKIPLLRSLPGFRTHTLWKETVGILAYIIMLFILIVCPKILGIPGVTELFIFYMLVPMIIIFNIGNLLRFFPKSLRRNNRLFFMIRTFIMLVSIFAPMLVEYFIL